MNTTKMSEKDSLQGWLGILKGQTFRTIILSIILLIIMGSLRPDNSSGLYQEQYWALKSKWHHCADTVLAGDSRVLIGLSPLEMKKTFKDKRIYNYGFDSAWFSEKYLEAIEDVLDPQSSEKMIILAITPRALTERNNNTDDFFEVSRLSEQDKFMHIYFPKMMNLFGPLSLRDAMENLFPGLSDSQITLTYHKDGWVSVHKMPLEVKKQLKRYREFYSSRPMSSENISRVMKYVSDWQQRGIKVVGFLFPTCKQMYELENQISGFNEKEFVSQFEQAGGRWMYIDPTKYTTYDGAHLQKDSAIRFSNDFNKLLNEIK